MPRERRISRHLGELCAMIAGLAGCGQDNPAGPGEPATVAIVVVSPVVDPLAVGGTHQMQAIAKSSTGSPIPGAVLQWSSENTLVAQVNTTGVVEARGPGKTRITATAGGRSGHTEITVEERNPVPAIAGFIPAQAFAGRPDLTLTITGTGFRPNARVHWNDQARPTQYVSTTELKATIWAADLAQTGTARVQVINVTPGGGASPESEFTIAPQPVPVAAVELSREVAITMVGRAVPLSVRLRDAAGNELQERLVTWTSSNQLVATVSGAGLVQAVGMGEVVITASSEGRSATLALSVGTQPVHLIMDNGGTALSALDLRLGGVQPFWHQAPAYSVSDPTVSPDGRWIAYTLAVGTVRQIAVLDQATHTYQFVSGDGTSEQPAWSPVGNRIALRSARAGRSDIWVMDPDGSNEVNLTSTMPQGWNAEFPAWSPDGTRLVFAAGPTASTTHLYLVKADGTGLQPLLISQYRDTEPAWRFDQVVFVRQEPDGTSNLFRIPVGGGPLIQLTHLGNARSPAWSPDGRWVAFVAAEGMGPGDIMVVRPYENEVRMLSRRSEDGGGRHPTWLTHN